VTKVRGLYPNDTRKKLSAKIAGIDERVESRLKRSRTRGKISMKLLCADWSKKNRPGRRTRKSSRTVRGEKGMRGLPTADTFRPTAKNLRFTRDTFFTVIATLTPSRAGNAREGPGETISRHRLLRGGGDRAH